jgi:3'(2'), 5'-bisphosphate nucleotidase
MRDAGMTETLTRLAREAGAAIMAVYASTDFGTRAKHDASPVTDADLAADAILAAGLAAAWPHIPVVSEERVETHADSAPATHFLVDPLDGTREFVGRRGDFTVNVALIEGGVAVAGVVYAPVAGRLFRTDHGGGAVEEAADGAVRRIAVAQADPEALRVVASKSHRDAATDAYIARYPVADIRSAGSSLKFCLVAAGEADLYPRLGRTMEWDTAAGHAVLSAAGGAVVRFDDRTPLRYGKPGRENPAFIAHGFGVALR